MDTADQIYLPNDYELMAARGAIVSYISSIKDGNLEPNSDVLDTIIKAVVISLRWSPQAVTMVSGSPLEQGAPND